MLSVNTNIPSLVAARVTNNTNGLLNNSMNRVATGVRINKAADDPAGMIASETLQAMLATLDAATRTYERMNQVANVADGAIGEMSELMLEARSISVSASNSAGVSDVERDAYQMEMDSILSTVNRIASTTEFNGEKVFDGSLTFEVEGSSLTVDALSTGTLGETDVDGTTYALSDLGSGGSLSMMSGDLSIAQQVIDGAMNTLTSMRGQIGSFQKHTLNSFANSNKVAMENVAAANSLILDTDYALESAEMARYTILANAGNSALNIANQNPQNILDLLA